MEECSTAIRWLDPQPGEHILDIGCGDGAYDKKIAGVGAIVTGIDIHEKRLSAARKYNQNERTRYLFMDASRMNFPEATFDKVMSLCVLEHLNDDELVMRNIYRVLKPGGLFVFSADSLSKSEITSAERSRHQQRYAVNTFYTVKNVRDKLVRAGFDLIDSQYILSSHRDLKFIRLSWKLDNLHHILGVLRIIGYAALGAARKVDSLISRRRRDTSEGGLTLLIKTLKCSHPDPSRMESE